MPGGIFCIENWSGDLRSGDTVRPLLEFLERCGGARVVHQRVSTPRELAHYLARFASLSSYQVGYLAMHGTRGRVWVGSTQVTLERLADWSRLDERPVATEPDLDESDYVVDLSGKVLYLGSCATLRVSPKRLEALRRQTGAAAVCGYTKTIDWFSSSGFDVMLLAALARAAESGKPGGFREAIRRVDRDASTLLDKLGFVSEPDWTGRRATRPAPKRA